MRITAKGQVTIPQAIREAAGLLPHTDVVFILDDDGVRMVRADSSSKPDRGRMLVARLRGSGDHAMTTDEILALTRGE